MIHFTQHDFLRTVLFVMGLLAAVGLLIPSAYAQITVSATADASGNWGCNKAKKADDSLRQAICYANAGNTTEIILPAGTYILDLTDSSWDDNNETGDLDIYIGSGNSLTITGAGAGSTIIDAQDNADFGRVMHILSGNVTLENLTITGGNSIGRGAGIYVDGSDASLTLENCVITGNDSTLNAGGGDDGGGGGIDNEAGTVTINNSTISSNSAIRNGGGIYSRNGTLTITNSTISNNSSGSYAGGIYSREGNSLSLTNSTISGNTADNEGGGIFAFKNSGSQTITIHSCTIVNNTASYGGGISRWSTGGYGTIKPTLTNTIIANNSSGDCVTDNITSNGYNLIEDTSGHGGTPLTTQFTDITGSDPLLDALAANGGPTYTHALQDSSPAIDAGGDCGAADQRGESRPVDGDGNGSAVCDIGAYEAPEPSGVELTLADEVTEGSSITGTVTCKGATSGPVTVSLTPNDGVDTYLDTIGTTSIQVNCDGNFTLEAVGDDGSDEGETVTVEASAGTESDSQIVTIIDNEKVLFFQPASLTIEEGETQQVNLCRDPDSGVAEIKVNLTANPAGEITPGTTTVKIDADTKCSDPIDVSADDDADDDDETIVVTATESTSVGYSDATLDVALTDDDRPRFSLSSTKLSIPKDGGTATIVISRSPTAHCDNDAAVLQLDLTDYDEILEITSVDSPSGAGSITCLDVGTTGKCRATVSLAAGECETSLTVTGLSEDGTVTLEATGTYDDGSGSQPYIDNDGNPAVESLEVVVEVGCDWDTRGGTSENLSSHAFPTSLLIASYDWLTNFYDRNIASLDGSDNRNVGADGHQNDPDTDNFNKIILQDANLFPMYTATINDTEFPNITSRNTAFINDYVNRAIAVAPNYINATTFIPCGEAECEIKATGLRSALQWVFVTDPANHNLRRYEFAKHQGFYYRIEFNTDLAGTIGDASDIDDSDDLMKCDATHCSDGEWYRVSDSSGWFNCNPGGDALYYPKKIGNAQNSVDGSFSFTITLPEAIIPLASLPVNFIVDSHDNSGELNVFLNKGEATEQTRLIDKFNNADCGTPPETAAFSNIDATFDVDADTDGIQISITVDVDKNHGGIIIGGISINQEDRQDRGFGVDTGGQYYDPSGSGYMNITGRAREARWNNIGTFLETVPPRSYLGYDSYRQLDSNLRQNIADPKPNVGYGFTTNTSFTTADNVRFKNPRDVDVYRDYFDYNNGGPVYIFVADTMNSRIQVFMNATASAGDTGATFPVRPVRVKAPTDDISDANSTTAFNSNEVAMRLYSSTASIGFGDGRKSDVRPFLPNYTTDGSVFLNVSTGKGEFYYPHGVAVDQDPDTKDVYLFVADTFNHRIQVFRDATGVTPQAIGNKRFDFEFEAGWGAYPVNTSGQPGAYKYKYPKGIDVSRFANNSSYLYVVDSKNYRLMKFLVTETDSGFQSVSAVAGYGRDSSGSFATNLLLDAGTSVTSTDTSPGFLNPQDVTTGYSGFFTYTSIGGDGLKFLDNHHVYVTDYARNDTSTTQAALNMRVMQFLDVPRQPDLQGVWLPWATESNIQTEGGNVLQSVFGASNGLYDSLGEAEDDSDRSKRPGPAENTGTDGYFTDRPLGIAALAWETTEPFDIRVMNNNDNAIQSNGDSITAGDSLTIGASSGRYFWFPESDKASYINYSSEMDGRRIARVHIFCYDDDGNYISGSHQSGMPPFDVLAGCADSDTGYMKVVAEDVDFKYSGRTGTQIFKID